MYFEIDLGDKLSLAKLESHEKEDVWLFISNSFYEQADHVHDLLQDCSELKRIIRIKGIGWNVLANYSNAKRLILEGLVRDTLLIKFIYSNRNGEKASQVD